MSDGTSLLSAQQMGTFDEDGNYIPRVITEDDMVGTTSPPSSGDSVLEFEDGDLVTGTVVKIDHDEVLLDIGFKSEGVIPARELSIRNDVDPSEIVSIGDKIECLSCKKRTRRDVSSSPRARPVREGVEQHRRAEEPRRSREGRRHRSREGWTHRRHRSSRIPAASLVELRRVRELQPYIGKTVEAKIIELDRNRNNVRALAPRLARRDPEGAAWRLPVEPEARRAPPRPSSPRLVNFGAFVDLGGMERTHSRL